MGFIASQSAFEGKKKRQEVGDGTLGNSVKRIERPPPGDACTRNPLCSRKFKHPGHCRLDMGLPEGSKPRKLKLTKKKNPPTPQQDLSHHGAMFGFPMSQSPVVSSSLSPAAKALSLTPSRRGFDEMADFSLEPLCPNKRPRPGPPSPISLPGAAAAATGERQQDHA